MDRPLDLKCQITKLAYTSLEAVIWRGHIQLGLISGEGSLSRGSLTFSAYNYFEEIITPAVRKVEDHVRQVHPEDPG